MQVGAKSAPLSVLQEKDLHELSRHAVTKSFPRNTIIVSEGDSTDALYIVLSGKVRIFLANENGKEVTLNVEGPGEYFCEMTLDGGPRSASVMTLEPSRFLIIPRADMEAFLAGNPEFAMRLIHKLINRVRVLTENVRSLALMDVYGRIARLLLEFAVESDGKLVITERLTQKEIASRVGASREMVSLILKDLSSGGYIRHEGHTIVIERTPPPRW